MSDSNNIQKELLEISPKLASALKKEEGYLLPKGYYSELKKEISLSLQSEVYKVPDDYFQNLEASIKNEIEKEPKKSAVQRRILPTIITVAASFLLITFILTKEPVEPEQSSLAEQEMNFDYLEDEIDVEEMAMLIEEETDLDLLEDEDFEEYLETVILELDENDLIELLN